MTLLWTHFIFAGSTSTSWQWTFCKSCWKLKVNFFSVYWNSRKLREKCFQLKFTFESFSVAANKKCLGICQNISGMHRHERVYIVEVVVTFVKLHGEYFCNPMSGWHLIAHNEKWFSISKHKTKWFLTNYLLLQEKNLWFTWYKLDSISSLKIKPLKDFQDLNFPLFSVNEEIIERFFLFHAFYERLIIQMKVKISFMTLKKA